MNIERAFEIMGDGLIGPKELNKIADNFNIEEIKECPEIPFDEKFLSSVSGEFILVLGVSKDKNGAPLTINSMRDFFGYNPLVSEPCFYNQDWYLGEKFAKETVLEDKWYLIKKEVRTDSRGADPKFLTSHLGEKEKFPSAVLTAYVFFAYYFLNNGAMLWRNDFVWCHDSDANGDQIYTGRYEDPMGINKRGFNIHRHLSIKNNYGAIIEM